MLALAVALVAAQPALAEKAPLELAPFSPWHVEWTKETCVVRSGYGTKEEPVILQIERFAPHTGFAVVVVGKPFAKFAPGKVTIRYGPAGAIDEHEDVLDGTSGSGLPVLFFHTSSVGPRNGIGEFIPVSPDQEKAVTSIAISKRGKPTVILKTGRLDKMFAEMRKCTDDLVRSWKLDPEKLLRAQRGPIPVTDSRHWIKASDYPYNMLRAGKRSLINFVLLVDAAGNVSDCRIQRSYGDEAFVRRTCQALSQRAKFEPALDEKGQPIPSFFATGVRWMIG